MIPNVAGLSCDKLLDSDFGEYMRRYYIPRKGNVFARYHNILADDPQRDFHDHPWDFVSHLLSGTYIEHTPDGTTVYTAPCVIRRKAEQLHRLELPEGPVWSYILHTPVRRVWGFQTNDGWVPYSKYRDIGSVEGCGGNHPFKPAQKEKAHYKRRQPKW